LGVVTEVLYSRYFDACARITVVCIELTSDQFNHLGIVSPHNAVTGLSIQSLPNAVEDSATQFVEVGRHDGAVSLCELNGRRTGQVEVNLYPHRP